MMSRTLISPVEVVAKGHFEHNYDSKILCSHISIAEEKFLRSEDSCFGEKMYQQLLNDMVLYQDYDLGVHYSVGDNVIFDGVLYTNILSSIGILPVDSSAWSVLNKFETPIHQILWDEYLWHYLALAVQHTATFKTAYRSSSKGIVRLEADFVKAAEYAGVKALKEELLDNMVVLKSAMHRFLIENKAYFPSCLGNISCTSKHSSISNAGIGLFVRK